MVDNIAFPSLSLSLYATQYRIALLRLWFVLSKSFIIIEFLIIFLMFDLETFLKSFWKFS